MGKTNEAKFEDRNDAPLRSYNFVDLLGKKSVKATFRLRSEVISILSILSTQLGIKQKSLFDYMMEDENALHVFNGVMRSYANAFADIQTLVKKFHQDILAPVLSCVILETITPN
jgi:hypothetical protein